MQRLRSRPHAHRVARSAVVLAFAVALALLTLPAGRATANPVFDLEQFVRLYGEPPTSDFARLRIPSLGVDAPVGQRTAGPDGNMALPQGPADVVWYDFSDWYALGGRPGGGGNAIFSGHLDYAYDVPYAGVRYEGSAVFANIGRLQQGDLIELDYGRQTLRYFVVWSREVGPDSDEWPAMFSDQVDADSVTLFTCGGSFDTRSLEYSVRTVVRAILYVGRPQSLPRPAPGGFTYGRAGTNNPAAIVAAQNFDIESVYGQDAQTKEWLVYVPGAPAFVNTLIGHLTATGLVIVVGR